MGKGKSKSTKAGKPRVTRAQKNRAADMIGLALVWVITAAMLIPTITTVYRDALMLGAKATAPAMKMAKKDWDPHGAGTFKVTYRFMVDGKQFEGRDVIPAPWRPGDPILVEYLVRDPKKNRPDGSTGYVELVFFVLGSIFAGCSLWLTYKAILGEKI